MNKRTVLHSCPVCDKGQAVSIITYDGERVFFCTYCLTNIKVVEGEK